MDKKNYNSCTQKNLRHHKSGNILDYYSLLIEDPKSLTSLLGKKLADPDLKGEKHLQARGTKGRYATA